jgi:hypothetical protein
MKTLIINLLTAITIGAISPVWAQSEQAGTEQYKAAMTDALAIMSNQSQQTPVAEMLASANQFERIAGAEPGEWLPRYYAALEYVFCGFAGKDAVEKDKYLDKADALLKQAETLSPANDELMVLRAYIAQARLVVDPMSRWQTYGPAAAEAITQAKVMNAGNPRPYVLEGSSLMFTPEQFGGGPKAACPVLKQAAEKMATFKPASELHPRWGQKNIESFLSACK